MSHAVGTPPARLVVDTARRLGSISPRSVAEIFALYSEYDAEKTLAGLVRHGVIEPVWTLRAGKAGRGGPVLSYKPVPKDRRWTA